MKKPVNEADLLKSGVAKQRNEIGRLTNSVERLMEEKRLLVLDVRHARDQGGRAVANQILNAIRDGATIEHLQAAIEVWTQIGPASSLGRAI